MNYIKNEKLYFGFISGAREVMNNRLFLNKINVFPVADGDTGSNLFSTMQSIVKNSEKKLTIKQTLESIADSAIIGARGNSGLIFAQYFQGISEFIKGSDRITPEEFVEASRHGMHFAYNAVENPVEGTMLTTMRTFHDSMHQSLEHGLSFDLVLEDAYKNVEVAVENTTNQLSVLKKASVVDSGAKGFAYFIKGFIEGIKGHLNVHNFEDDNYIIPEINHNHNEEIKFRYCTEALIEKSEWTVDILKKSLEKFGDSIIVAGNNRKMRVHIHTDSPAVVFKIISEKSQMINQKVDDMIRQYKMVNERKYKSVIVTDSIADLPIEYIDEEQIHVVNLDVLIGENQYIDKLSITNEELFNQTKNKGTHPTTSQPSFRTIENVYNYLLSYYEKILVISVSDALSGTYNAFNKTAEKFNQNNRILLINSKQNSVAQGLLVWKASQLMKEGISIENIYTSLNESIKKSKILVKIHTLDNMIASGRLSVKAGALGKKIGLKPIITLDDEGKGAIEKIAFSDKGSLKKILKHLIKVNEDVGISSYAVTYVDDLELGNKLASEIEKNIGIASTFVVESSTIIAAGAGKGAVAVGYITN